MQRSVAVAVLALACLPLLAQVHGTPPSVTSIGPGGVSTAPPPSVTSMGPSGWQIPHGRFFPKNPQLFPRHPGFNGGFHSGQRHHGAGGYVVPLYVPYPVYAYPDETYTDATGPAPAEAAFPATVPNVPAAAVPYQPPVAAPPPVAPAPEAAPAPQLLVPEITILVFRDGRQLEVTNYAIVGEELINLSGKGPRRIPLADLDLPATTRVNDDRGVSFRLPNG